MPKDVSRDKAGGIGAIYCSLVSKYAKYLSLKVKEAQAAEVPSVLVAALRQDTTSRRKVFAPKPQPETPPAPHATLPRPKRPSRPHRTRYSSPSRSS